MQQKTTPPPPPPPSYSVDFHHERHFKFLELLSTLFGRRKKEALNATTKLILQMYRANLKYAFLRAFMKGAPRAVG